MDVFNDKHKKSMSERIATPPITKDIQKGTYSISLDISDKKVRTI